MKRTILMLALVATTFGAFAQTPAQTTKPVVKSEKKHAKATKEVVTKTPVKKKSGK
ncbi:hypothetical protein ACXZ1K_17515 [Pedobacter sp. PWIIR3]